MQLSATQLLPLGLLYLQMTGTEPCHGIPTRFG